MKKLIVGVLSLLLAVTMTGCSNAGNKFEKELPQNIMEMIDAGWTVKENYTIEPRKDELNTVWLKNQELMIFIGSTLFYLVKN